MISTKFPEQLIAPFIFSIGNSGGDGGSANTLLAINRIEFATAATAMFMDAFFSSPFLSCYFFYCNVMIVNP